MNHKSLAAISQIWRYPVSSLGGERLEAAKIDAGGITGDRLWGLACAKTGEVAGPERRKRWRPAPNILSRTAAGAPEILVEGSDWMAVTSQDAIEATSRFLGFPAVFETHAPYGSENAGGVAPRYQRAALHILTTASLRKLMTLLPDVPIDARRFRPNLVIDTDDLEGFIEHDLIGRSLAIGETRITVSEPCARCTFTSLQQGELTFDPRVMQAIAKHGGGGFGVLCAVEASGTIHFGDPVTVL